MSDVLIFGNAKHARSNDIVKQNYKHLHRSLISSARKTNVGF